MSEHNSMKLTEEQLLNCLKSLNVPARINDLKYPSKEFVIDVFEIFLKDLQINIDSSLLRPFEAIKHFENPDLYEYGQILILLSCTMTEILQEISGSPSLIITVSDIVSPKPKKTKKILHYLIFFWNYYLKKSALFRELEHTYEPQIQKASNMRRENEILEEKYQECVVKLNNMTVSKENLNQIYAVNAEKEANLEKTRKEILEEYQGLKEKENQLSTNISKVDLEIITSKEKLNELDQLIISSPEKINADVQKLRDAIREVEQRILEKESERKDKHKQYLSLLSAELDISKKQKNQQKIYDELQLVVEAGQNLSTLHVKCEEENASLRELASSQEMKEAMTDFYTTKLAKIQLSRQEQLAEITETTETVQRQILEVKKRLEEVKLEEIQLKEQINKEALSVNEVIEQCKKARTQTEEMKVTFERERQYIKKGFTEFCRTFEAAAKRRLE